MRATGPAPPELRASMERGAPGWSTPSPGTVLPPRFRLVALECSLATTDLARLERLYSDLPPERWEEAFTHHRSMNELAVLRTCHRLEAYCWTDSPEEVLGLLSALVGPEVGGRPRRDQEAVHHLFRVAAGLESTAVGEREVREQVRSSAARVVSRAPRPVLRPLLLSSVKSAESANPDVAQRQSIASLAASRILEEFAQPFPRVVIVGTGIVGRTVAERLAPYGRLTLLYRTRAPDPEYLRRLGARAVPWEGLSGELAWADVAVTAVKTGGRIIDPTLLRPRARPLVLVDLGMPRNVDPVLSHRPGVRLIDLDGLRSRTAPGLPLEVEETVAASAREAAESLEAAGFESWVDAYRREAEETRAALFAEAMAELPGLSGAERAGVDRLTRRLVGRLLEGPTQGLRGLPPSEAGDERRRWAAELLRIGARRP